MKTIHKILKLLSDGQFHSGENLGEQVGVTRSAIWKNVKEIEQRGVTVESIVGKGYRINGGLSLLNESSVIEYINRKPPVDIKILDQVTSTNEFLMGLAKTSNQKNIAVFAEQQTQGKGRRERNWVSPYGNNLYHSLLWHFSCDPTELSGLSLAIALAITNTLKEFGLDNKLGVKWPNDIYYDGKKLGGVLLEMLASPHERSSIVIGVGINTRLSNRHAELIDQPWTSIEHITQQPVNRNKLAGLLLNNIISTISLFEQKGFSAFLADWKHLDLLDNKPVTLITHKEKINGIMKGITNQGQLIVENENNELQHYFSGEVSLRPQSPV